MEKYTGVLLPSGKVNPHIVRVIKTGKFISVKLIKIVNIISIDEACSKCDHCYFTTISECQKRQSKDAKAMGFHYLVCPQQFIKGGDTM